MFSSNNSQVSNDVKYIEDVCSVYLRTGTGSSQTVTTGIKENTGALVISKSRSAATDWAWYDTFRGATYDLVSNSTAAQTTQSQGLTSFNTDGHTWGTLAKVNTSGATYVDTVLKPTPKFFDIVTWTGDDAANRQISHSLGSVPGCIIVKRTDASATWRVWHQNMVSNSANLYLNQLNLNTTDAVNSTYGEVWGTSNNVTSTTFQIGSLGAVNASGGTYVAYLFAHNAGGFGLTGTDNVISCGSFTGTGALQSINLGYEPQFVLFKKTSSSDNWRILDNMRGWSITNQEFLFPNLSDAEAGSASWGSPTATGMNILGSSGADYIYIAIRRGPMKVPTDATSVFKPLAETGTGSARTVNAGFPVDSFFIKDWTGLSGPTAGGNVFYDRLRGNSNVLQTQSTSAEAVDATYTALFNSAQNGVVVGSAWSSYGYREYCFRRAPSFFDEVCYTASFPAPDYRAVANHNLTVTPELIIIKARNLTDDWYVYHSALGVNKYIRLNSTAAEVSSSNVFAVSSTTFSTNNVPVASTYTYVAYLFATCAGVSKVGTYTGTGTTLQVNCGFTAGARFVLIKKTSGTGSWYVWDSARGIVSGNDPYLLLNSTAAEVTNTDYIDTYSAGFEISSTAPSEINENGGSFIFFAVA